MEMYYDGALVMPKNYAVVDEEEMEYVGGGNGWYNSVGFIAGAIDAAIVLIPVFAQANQACKAGKALSAAMKVAGATKEKLIDITMNVVTYWLNFNVSRNTVTGIVGAIWTFAGLSIGGIIANGIDKRDCNPNNGYIFG